MSGEHLHLHHRMYNKQFYLIDNLKKPRDLNVARFLCYRTILFYANTPVLVSTS